MLYHHYIILFHWWVWLILLHYIFIDLLELLLHQVVVNCCIYNVLHAGIIDTAGAAAKSMPQGSKRSRELGI